LKDWLANYVHYLDALRNYIADFPDTAFGQEIIIELNATYPATFANITMQELITDYY
jgi:hypothetical protein